MAASLASSSAGKQILTCKGKQNARHLQTLPEQAVFLAIFIKNWHDLGMRVALSLSIENKLCGFHFWTVEL